MNYKNKEFQKTPPHLDDEEVNLYPAYENTEEFSEEEGEGKDFGYEYSGELEDFENTEYLPPDAVIGGAAPNSKQLENLKAVYSLKIEPRLQDISEWRSDGLSLQVIARRLGVSLYQFSLAKNTFCELYVVLMEATDLTVAKLESAAIQRALGYYKPEIIRKFAISKGRKIPVEETHKYGWVQDGNMQKFLLSQLKPEKYGPKVAQNVTNNTLVVSAETTTAKDLVSRLNKIKGRNDFAEEITAVEED